MVVTNSKLQEDVLKQAKKISKLYVHKATIQVEVK